MFTSSIHIEVELVYFSFWAAFSSKLHLIHNTYGQGIFLVFLA